jgi:hypothetical protein
MFAASLKNPYQKQSVSEDSMKSYVKKLNREFREFFGLGNLATAFSFINGILNPNFNLTNYRENNRNRSQVFNKVGAALKDHEDFDDPFANEK